MTKHKQKLGKWGELAAANYLIEKGYLITASNVRTPHGEIDLIADYMGELVFVEVKTRSSGEFGRPEDAITPSKLDHMIESAQYYIQSNFSGTEPNWRIDVIAIRTNTGDSNIEIIHFENVAS